MTISSTATWFDAVTIAAPADRWKPSYLTSLRTFDPGGYPSSFDLATLPGAWEEYLRAVRAMQDPAQVQPGFVPQTTWWIVRDDDFLGRISLRHHLNPALEKIGGHIGYAIAPRWRNRGVATRALGLVLPEARAMGLDRVLLTCADSNAASIKVIQANGGALIDTRVMANRSEPTRRYWIDLA